jgi:outer membrane murein-binding lipoprotein Lpp
MNRNLITAVVVALPLLLLAGCGGSAVSSERVAKLELRVAKLEARNAKLSQSLARATAELRSGLTALDRRARANDEALYVGVSMAQAGVLCNFEPRCHVPVGSPGAIYTKKGQPGRIFATPFP